MISDITIIIMIIIIIVIIVMVIVATIMLTESDIAIAIDFSSKLNENNFNIFLRVNKVILQLEIYFH